MGSLAASIRAWDGRTRASTGEHGQTGEEVWYFAKPSLQGARLHQTTPGCRPPPECGFPAAARTRVLRRKDGNYALREGGGNTRATPLLMT